MTLIPGALEVYRRATALPLIKHVLMLRYEHIFRNATNCQLFRGVFDTYEEAAASAEATKPLGYDNKAGALLYRERMHRVYPSDYPVMFWLSSLLQHHPRLFDLGGHTGITFYAYRKYFRFPESVQWTVYDLPAEVSEGEKLAREINVLGIRFTTSFSDANDHEILLASGSLQYIQTSLSDMLCGMWQKPRHIIVSMLPLYDGKEYFTLNNIGTAFCPYIVRNRAEFIRSITAMGYELIDIWENPEKACIIPFYPNHSVQPYYGAYFMRKT